MHVRALHAYRVEEEDIRSPTAAMWVSETEPGFLKEQLVLLASPPSLQPVPSFLQDTTTEHAPCSRELRTDDTH